MRRLVELCLAIREIIKPAVVGLEDNLPNARRTEFLGMLRCRRTKCGGAPRISSLILANAFQEITGYDDIHRRFVVLVRRHFSIRLVAGNSQASLGEHG